MARISIKPFASAVCGGGLSISVGNMKAGQFIRVGMTAEAQKTHFGGELKPGRDAITVVIDDEPTKRHLMVLAVATPDEPAAVPVSGGIRGSVSIRIAPYLHLAPGKRPPERLPVSHAPKRGEVVVKIPEWARPPIPKPGFGKSIMEV